MANPVKSIEKHTAAAMPGGQGKRVIKYSDKSVSQPNLIPVFDELRTMLLCFVKASLTVHGEGAGQLHICSKKETHVLGKKRSEIHFASLLVQKGYIGFYFFPVYTNEALKNSLAPELLKCLKGKSCFHIKKLDSLMKSSIQDALEKGYGLYERQGWV